MVSWVRATTYRTAPDTGAACPGGVECLGLPGPDGILGEGPPNDDVTYSLSNFTRSITFNQVFLPTASVNNNLIAVKIHGCLHQTRLAGPQLHREWAHLQHHGAGIKP